MRLPIEDVRELHGKPLFAADGDKIGGIEEVYCDKATNEPEWFGINAGFLGMRRIAVPAEGARLEDDGVWVPYESQLVKDAPAVDSIEISQEAEAQLYRHYGIAYSRDASPTGLPASNVPEEAARPYDTPPGEDVQPDLPLAVEAADMTPVLADAPVPEVVDVGLSHPDIDVQAPLLPDPTEIKTEPSVAPYDLADSSDPAFDGDPGHDVRAVTGTVQPIPEDVIDPAFMRTDRWDAYPVGGTAADIALDNSDAARVTSSAYEPTPAPERQQTTTRRRVSPLRGFLRDLPTRRLLYGAAAGAAATLPMTAYMFATHRLLPKSQRRPLPPRDVTMNVAGRAGVDTGQVDEHGRRLLTTASHYGYGAAAGAAYGLLADNPRLHPVAAGGLFGAIVWASSYMGWLPAAHLFPRPHHEARRRNVLMLTANILWGAVAALLFRRMTKRT